MVQLNRITVVSYCHEAHEPWIPFWIEQISAQDTTAFHLIFIFHNWKDKEKLKASKKLLDDAFGFRIMLYEYESEPVIGEVIDFACSKVETEFFAHWDVDDPMHPSRIRLQDEFLSAYPDVDFLNARAVGFHGEIPEWPEDLMEHKAGESPLVHQLTDPRLQEHDQIKRVLMGGHNCLAHGLMVYRPEVILKLGGFSRSDVKLDGKSPDFETWKKALMAGYKFHRLPELLMMWRLDSSSIRHV